MAHLCRWVFNGLAALSLLLLFATVMLWAWDSHKGNPTIWNPTDIQANSAYYRVGVHANSVVILRARPWPPVWEPVNWGEFDPPIDFLGLHARWASSGPIRGGVPNSSWFFVEAPFLWIVAAAVCFPSWWSIRRFYLHPVRPAEFCRICGYDLRATPERCSECGTIVPK
jgi:hypothetical protein